MPKIKGSRDLATLRKREDLKCYLSSGYSTKEAAEAMGLKHDTIIRVIAHWRKDADYETTYQLMYELGRTDGMRVASGADRTVHPGNGTR